MDYRNDRFQIGDIIRLKKDHQVFGRINKAVRMSDVDDSGRYDEYYYWTEYYFDDGTMFKSYDEDKYELIYKEVGFNQIKEYDKVLVANGCGLEGQGYWHCDFAAGWTNEPTFYEKRLMTISQPDVKDFPMFLIMPYNDYTKKFIGGNLSRPDFYYNSRSLPDILQNMKERPEDYKEIDNDIYIKIKYKNLY
jgi:hypothetical protein